MTYLAWQRNVGIVINGVFAISASMAAASIMEKRQSGGNRNASGAQAEKRNGGAEKRNMTSKASSSESEKISIISSENESIWR